ncbi:hypothetical protein ACOME3_009326 [Neoechinorhynchus agilis]
MKVSDLRKKVSSYVTGKSTDPYSGFTSGVEQYVLTPTNNQPIYMGPSPIDMLTDPNSIAMQPSAELVSVHSDYTTSPFSVLPSNVATMPEAALIMPRDDVSRSNGLTYDANTNRFNDEQIINDLRNRISTLQDQNKALLQSSASNGPNPQRTQLQLIAAQMQLQDQALQIQLMLDDYAEKVKQQNAFLLNYQQELNYIKSRLTDLDYVMHAIQHANSKSSAE